MIVAGASAYSRIIDFPRISQIAQAVGAKFFVDMAHIAGLVARRPSEPRATHGFRLHHHPQDAARAARRPRPCHEKYAKELDRVTFPGIQGGPLEHIIAAKAVCLKEAWNRDSASISNKWSPTPRRASPGSSAADSASSAAGRKII